MRRITLLLAALLALAGLVAASPSYAGPAAEDDPMVGAPSIGDCYNMTAQQGEAMSTTKKPIDCRTKHTLLIGEVEALPASVDWSDDAAVVKAALKICDPFWDSYYDSLNPRSFLTLLQGYMFLPTEAQQDAGARWASCEIGLLADDRLLPLPKGGPAKATKKPADSISRCANKKYVTIPCSAKHSWRATYAFTAKARGSETKVRSTLEKAAARTCSRKVASERWLRSWHYVAKNTYVIACFSETKR
jgi:hypothetical protein